MASMSHDTVFSIPADFVVSRVRMTPGELAYGHAHSWVDDTATVKIAEDLVAAGSMPEPVEQLATVFSQELWRVPRLVDGIEAEPGSAPHEVWLFLALAWLHDHQVEHENPLTVIAMLYADFDYPAEIEDLVYYSTAPPGAATGIPVVHEAWTAYLRRQATRYATR